MAFCKDLGFELQLVFSDSKPSATHLTVGSVLEIFSFGKSKKMEYKSIVECIGQIVAIRDVNIQACISKIHRAASSDKKKRGKLKEEFRNETFIVPTESTSASTIASTSGCTLVSLQMPSTATLTTETKEKKVNILQTQLKERRLKVQELVQSNKLLKRKLGRRESKKCRESFQRKVEKETAVALKSVKTVQKELKVKTALLTKAQTRSKNNYSSLINANRKLKSLEHRVKSLENDKEKLDAILRKTEQEKKTICDRNKIVLKENKDLHISNDYMQGLLLDECDLHVYDHQSNTFTPELVECAMNLTNLKVATHNVGPVIREVSSLCGKIPNRLPSRTTVDNMVDRKVSLSQKQLGTVLSAKEETTLYTDETRKHGHTYQSYLITDKDKNSYLLGLREMENKSGQCTLDTMKEILKDISDYCSHSEDKEADCEPGQTVGYHILKNVCNTMSDRASTEKHFNVLLQEYRNKILPDVVYNYTNLTTQEKELCGQMNNFFCGLHLLVGIADVSEASLKKFETAYLDGKLIGSAQKPELQRYHKSESGTLRLLRTCSKAFAMGEDEKNGVFLPWKTYLGSKGEKKNHILRFKHNRFNMVFLIGQAVYYHSQDIQEFLGNVHGTSNDLLKAVLLDAKETLFLAGAKVLGLVSKFITAPLWRLIEAPGHILDMNMHFETLVDFLEKTSTDTVLAQEFLKGQSTPFNSEVDSSDAVLAKLLAPDELETIALPLVQSMCVAMKELLKRMVSEHLPGGKFWNVSSATRSAAESALKHNKSPEFIFGQLDHLISYRPNASVLANEAYLLYSYNKTSDWLHNLPDDEKKRVIESSRKEGRELRQKFKERLKEIEQKRLDAQKRKQLELKRLEQQRILKAENLTNDVCFYGLWQSVSQIEEGLSRLKGDKGEMLKALYSQLKFRRYVLKQRHSDSKVFNMSRKKADGKYEKLSVAELKANVTELIKSAATVTTDERQTSDIPLLVGKTIDHVFVDNTYRGVVVSVVPGFPMWYNVKYTNDEAIYAYNLIEDYRNGDVRIVVSSHSK